MASLTEDYAGSNQNNSGNIEDRLKKAEDENESQKNRIESLMNKFSIIGSNFEEEKEKLNDPIYYIFEEVSTSGENLNLENVSKDSFSNYQKTFKMITPQIPYVKIEDKDRGETKRHGGRKSKKRKGKKKSRVKRKRKSRKRRV